MYSPKFMILNVNFALKLSNYTSWKRFICFKNPKKCVHNTAHALSSTTIHCRSLSLILKVKKEGKQSIF